MTSTRRFVLIDRDGTLNVDTHYLSDPEQFELLPGAGAAIRSLNQAGLGVCVVTNQSGIARGYFDVARLNLIHERMRKLLAAEGAVVDGVYYCPHGPDEDCTCRKPLPGMVEQAVTDFGFDPAKAFVIGDKEVDVELGLGVGATTFLVRTGYGAQYAATSKAHHVVDDLTAAVGLILERVK